MPVGWWYYYYWQTHLHLPLPSWPLVDNLHFMWMHTWCGIEWILYWLWEVDFLTFHDKSSSFTHNAPPPSPRQKTMTLKATSLVGITEIRQVQGNDTKENHHILAWLPGQILTWLPCLGVKINDLPTYTEDCYTKNPKYWLHLACPGSRHTGGLVLQHCWRVL